ncbi:MAG TPA: Head fiber protein [Epulopiscium sp.]|nr:Head fiber protein [Candidatus Epulonipiscium sp.]
MGSSKNYTEQGGNRTIIGGELIVEKDGKLIFNEKEFKPAELQKVSTASTVEELKVDFNRLIIKLKAAGLMALK